VITWFSMWHLRKTTPVVYALAAVIAACSGRPDDRQVLAAVAAYLTAKQPSLRPESLGISIVEWGSYNAAAHYWPVKCRITYGDSRTIRFPAPYGWDILRIDKPLRFGIRRDDFGGWSAILLDETVPRPRINWN